MSTNDSKHKKPCNIDIVNGCASDEDYYDEEYWEGEPNQECEKCGRTYDDIGYDYQYCKACGWDADNKKFGFGLADLMIRDLGLIADLNVIEKRVGKN